MATNMSMAEMQKRMAELEARNRELELAAKRKLNFQVSDAGYVEVYGIPGKGRFSISCTPEGWQALFEAQDGIKAYLETNKPLIEARLANYRANGRSAKAVG